jgi:hypothetical protein
LAIADLVANDDLVAGEDLVASEDLVAGAAFARLTGAADFLAIAFLLAFAGATFALVVGLRMPKSFRSVALVSRHSRARADIARVACPVLRAKLGEAPHYFVREGTAKLN